MRENQNVISFNRHALVRVSDRHPIAVNRSLNWLLPHSPGSFYVSIWLVPRRFLRDGRRVSFQQTRLPDVRAGCEVATHIYKGRPSNGDRSDGLLVRQGSRCARIWDTAFQ